MMQLANMKVLADLGNYDLEIAPLGQEWIIQLRRHRSETVTTLETRRGDVRKFKNLQSAHKVACEITNREYRVLRKATL